MLKPKLKGEELTQLITQSFSAFNETNAFPSELMLHQVSGK